MIEDMTVRDEQALARLRPGHLIIIILTNCGRDLDRRVRAGCTEQLRERQAGPLRLGNGQISRSTTVWAAQSDGSRRCRRPPVLPKRWKNAKIHASSRVIRGIPD